MKYIHLILIGIIFFGCNKEESKPDIDYRDGFTGKYQVTLEYISEKEEWGQASLFRYYAVKLSLWLENHVFMSLEGYTTLC